MANDLSALQPVLYSAAQKVSQEAFGAISAISTTFDDKSVAFGDVVKVPINPNKTASNFTPSATSPDGADSVAESLSVQITKIRKVSFKLSAEQEQSLTNGGNYPEWVQKEIMKSMRTLRNEAEADCVEAIKVGASRAVGTAGTNPFASALTPLADARRILRDNGASLADLQFVGDSASEANLLKLGVVLDASQAGSDEERRSGILRRQYGFEMRTSAGLDVHTKGTGASYQLSAAGAVGDTSISVDTGSGTILAGDIVTFAGTTDKYVVNSALSGGSFSIGKPGLLYAEADNDAVSVGDSYTPNLCFDRDAIVGIMRPPHFKPNDMMRAMPISDESGLTYLFIENLQYGQTTWEVLLAWGFKAVNSEHIAILLG